MISFGENFVGIKFKKALAVFFLITRAETGQKNRTEKCEPIKSR